MNRINISIILNYLGIKLPINSDTIKLKIVMKSQTLINLTDFF
jgi:hypothetical protein